jgi:hypothetical protein
VELPELSSSELRTASEVSSSKSLAIAASAMGDDECVSICDIGPAPIVRDEPGCVCGCSDLGLVMAFSIGDGLFRAIKICHKRISNHSPPEEMRLGSRSVLGRFPGVYKAVRHAALAGRD